MKIKTNFIFWFWFETTQEYWIWKFNYKLDWKNLWTSFKHKTFPWRSYQWPFYHLEVREISFQSKVASGNLILGLTIISTNWLLVNWCFSWHLPVTVFKILGNISRNISWRNKQIILYSCFLDDYKFVWNFYLLNQISSNYRYQNQFYIHLIQNRKTA